MADEMGVVVERNGIRQTLYSPFPHQQRFHRSEAKYCLMSGGAGSGKSLCMRWDAYMRCLAIPRFTALILRRTMPELRKSHLQEVPFDAEALGLGKAAWHATFYELRFPNGSKVIFGHCEDEKTVATYLSSEFDAIYFDELATFSLNQFLFIGSRARRPKTRRPFFRPIVRGGTNPIGVGAAWVKKLFITKTVTPGEIPGYDPVDYENIHCTMDDNPALSEEYGASLLSLPTESLRRAMRYGEWVTEGQFFSEWMPTLDGQPWHVIDTMPTYRGRSILEAPHVQVVVAVDWGYSASGNPGYAGWFALFPDHSAIAFQEYVFRESLPEQVATEILRRSKGLKVIYTVGDPAMWAEHTGPSIAEKFAAAGLSMIEGDHQREPGWINVHGWLQEIVDTGVDRYPRLRFLRDGVPLLIRTMPDMVVNPNNPADMMTKNVEDDGPDVVRYFTMSRPGAPPSPGRDLDPGLREMLRRAAAKSQAHDRWAPAVL